MLSKLTLVLSLFLFSSAAIAEGWMSETFSSAAIADGSANGGRASGSRVAFAPTGQAVTIGGRSQLLSRQESSRPQVPSLTTAVSIQNPLSAGRPHAGKLSNSPVVQLVSSRRLPFARRHARKLIVACAAVAGIAAAIVLGVTLWRGGVSSVSSIGGSVDASGLTPGSDGLSGGNSSVGFASPSPSPIPALPSVSASATSSSTAAPSQSVTATGTPSPSPTPAPWWDRLAYDVSGSGAVPSLAVALRRGPAALTAVAQPPPTSSGALTATAVTLGFAIDTSGVVLNATVLSSGELLASSGTVLDSSTGGAGGTRRLLGRIDRVFSISPGPCSGCINFTIAYASLGLVPSNGSAGAAAPLAESDAWKRARMAAGISWLRSDAGAILPALSNSSAQASAPPLQAFPGGWLEVRRERLLHMDGRAPSAPFAPEPLAWSPVDMALRDPPPAADAAVAIIVTQPFDGKLTVVIESANGTRIRNLVSGQAYPAGIHRIDWDATDDAGNLIPPSPSLRWRAISHQGITPKFIMQFANGNESSLRPCCSNHGQFESAAAAPRIGWAFLGAPLTEGGNSLIAVGSDDKIAQTYVQPLGSGIWSVALAVDEDAGILYRINDGPGWGTTVGTGNTWVTNITMTVTRHGIAAGSTGTWPGNAQFCSLQPPYELGPGSRHPALLNTSDTSLRGVRKRPHLHRRCARSGNPRCECQHLRHDCRQRRGNPAASPRRADSSVLAEPTLSAVRRSRHGYHASRSIGQPSSSYHGGPQCCHAADGPGGGCG